MSVIPLETRNPLCVSRLTDGPVCLLSGQLVQAAFPMFLLHRDHEVLCAEHTHFLSSGLGSLRFTSLEFVNNLFSQI